MGIKNLKGFIKKNAPGAFSEINIKKLSGSTICIDSSILLYKFRYMYNSDNFHILGFLNKVIELLSYKIIPVFVFDGKPPEAKRETLIKRTETKNKLKERIGRTFWRKRESGKHRYIKFISNKIENKKLVKSLKHKVLPYPKDTSFKEEVQEIVVTSTNEFFE